MRGAELLARADVVVYDRLASPALLDLAPAHAELISVGQGAGPGRADPGRDQRGARRPRAARPGASCGSRAAIRSCSGAAARRPRRSPRPACRSRSCPAITSAIGAPAYAGIPVTHRGVSTHFTVVTGHEDPAKGRTDVDWEALARAGGTLVILMGAGRIGDIARRLIDGGRRRRHAGRRGPQRHATRPAHGAGHARHRSPTPGVQATERDRRRRRRRARPRLVRGPPAVRPHRSSSPAARSRRASCACGSRRSAPR